MIAIGFENDVDEGPALGDHDCVAAAPAAVKLEIDQAHVRQCWRELFLGHGPLWMRVLAWSCRKRPR